MSIVIDYIITRGSEPVSAKTLASMFGCPDTVIRRIINQARVDGVAICSCNKGYYYSTNREDINRTVASLMHRITSIQTAVNGLMSNL